MSNPGVDTPAAEPLMVSIAIQMGPLIAPFDGDLQAYADQLTAYIAGNVEKFADPRGGDLFLALTAKQGTEHRGSEYRSGHYVKDDVVDAVDVKSD